MQTAPAAYLPDPEDAPLRRADIFSRMSDVELLAELRRITALAARREDAWTAGHAGELFAAFYAARSRARVPAWLWEATRAFVRRHAP
jgi:hypothetical protein